MLFENKGNFDIVRISNKDAEVYNDHLHLLRKLVLQCENSYPNIKQWFDKKVIPGLKTKERIAYIGYLDEKPAVSAVVKRGQATKFCHLKLNEQIQDAHLGEAFFALMAFEAKTIAKNVHFTLPESLWIQEKGFFKSFGFNNVIKAGYQYRIFDTELCCSAPFQEVWKATLLKLPKLARAFYFRGNTIESNILLSVAAEFAKKIVTGQKKVEIRRKFSTKWKGQRVCLYATSPASSIVGEAVIKKVVYDSPENIWDRYHSQIGCTREQFFIYTNPLPQVYAIVLKEAIPYKKALTLNELYELTSKRLRPPQSYYILNNSKDWAEAVSMGSMLQNNFGHFVTL